MSLLLWGVIAIAPTHVRAQVPQAEVQVAQTQAEVQVFGLNRLALCPPSPARLRTDQIRDRDEEGAKQEQRQEKGQGQNCLAAAELLFPAAIEPGGFAVTEDRDRLQRRRLTAFTAGRASVCAMAPPDPPLDIALIRLVAPNAYHPDVLAGLQSGVESCGVLPVWSLSAMDLARDDIKLRLFDDVSLIKGPPVLALREVDRPGTGWVVDILADLAAEIGAELFIIDDGLRDVAQRDRLRARQPEYRAIAR